MSVLSVAEAAAAALARWRHARALHPAGRSFAGAVTIGGTATPTGVELLDRPGHYPATIRFSRGVPTPTGWPDVFGLAVRVHLPDGRRPFDLLASSSGRAPLLRQLPLPRRRFPGPYSTIMPYRSARGRRWLAVFVPPGGRRLVLAVASAVGRWQPFGVVQVDVPLDAATDAALGFDPIANLPAGLSAAGPLAALRERTYRGSRRARGARVQSVGSTTATV